MKNFTQKTVLLSFVFSFFTISLVLSQCGTTINSYPYNESFETGIGAWTQSTLDTTDWTRNSGGTTSASTGPTVASDGSFYMYTEASGHYSGYAIFESPCFDLTSASSADISFFYHMHGGDMGSLYLDVSTNDGATYPNTPLTISGEQQANQTDPWLEANVDLSAYVGQTIKLRFYGFIGHNFTSDMSIDDITVDAVTTPQPEILISGNATEIMNGDLTPSVADDTNFGTTATFITNTFTITNTGTLALNLTDLSPFISIGGANPLDFAITTTPSNSIAPGGSTTFDITFTPTANGTRSATISIANNDSNENPYTFNIQGTGVAPITAAPGGVTTSLALWLNDTDGLSYTDGQSISMWADQGRGSDAMVNIPGHEPTYRDNATKNINFNPVVEFDNSFATFTLDGDFSYDNTSTQFLEGSSGLYSQEMFIVLIPDDTSINNSFGFMDVFCGDSDIASNEEDATGIGFGDYTGRITGESISYAYSTFDNTLPGDGYAVHDGPSGGTYTGVSIINARNNTAATQQELYYNGNNIEANQNDIPGFMNINDSKYWIGRSEGWEASLNARVAEVISFSSRLSDSDLTDERNRVQSYLAIKYGITLGVNGISQDYVDSSGTVIWDQAANTGYNYDIAGIGRDDDSNLNQKQSSSINNATDINGPIEGILTMGLTDIYDTNNLNKSLNTNSLNDKDYLVWGSNNANLDAAPNVIAVDMSAGIAGLSTPVSFLGMQRIWKVVENGSDIGHVKVSIPQNAIRNISPPGDYLMFISDTPVFDPTADYRVMTNNAGNLETTYDFDNTKFITFGYAPQTIVERSVYFDGSQDYIDVDDALDLKPTSFTVSAWINRQNRDVTILSKRDDSYTEGYDLRILNNRRVEMSWENGSTQSIRSSTQIPENEWHQVAVTYNGTEANLYIDGVLDATETLSAPVATSQSFIIAAAGKTSTTDFFEGNIDEVRVWDAALTQEQLHYIMNQEIEENATFVTGRTLPNTITKNDASTIPWSNLAGYYPMSIYTYTNTNDLSGNNNQGALRNLNTVDFQTAPLPYESTANGDWDTNASWLNGTIQTIPGAPSIVDNTITVDWNIVETSHNITIDNSSLPAASNDNRAVLALDVKSNELTLTGNTATNTGNGLTVTHYLKVDGKIDLEGESQLIQTLDSDLDQTSAGTLERDQQGTQDLFTYNYWSSPVGTTNNTTNNNSYTVPQIFNDGTNPLAPLNINFITNSYDGTPTAPVGIADYWIWKFGNLGDSYYNWQHVRSTGSLLVGEGFTMKGIDDTGGVVSLEQNYVLEGKPNNGQITLPINTGNQYLIGNPYASAIDAHQFIMDNAPVINNAGATNGTLYFWEHWGGGSHVAAEYQGGYATYNLSGGAPAATLGTNTLGTGGTPTKLPGRYIPVAQGFFVNGEANGNIVFNNGQRVFQKEGVSSIFVKNGITYKSNNTTTTDNRMKIRLGFNSVDSIKRQLLVTVDANATAAIDYGYDGENTEAQIEDMYWMIDNKKFAIQGIDNIDASTILPIGLHTRIDGVNTFKIDELINVPSDLEIYIYDTVTSLYHDIKNNPDFAIDLPGGEYLDRFELRFNSAVLSTDDFVSEETGIAFYFANNNETIVINNPELQNIESVELFNMLGQAIVKFDAIETQEFNELKTKNLSTGNYILNINTAIGKIAKKVLVE